MLIYVKKYNIDCSTYFGMVPEGDCFLKYKNVASAMATASKITSVPNKETEYSYANLTRRLSKQNLNTLEEENSRSLSDIDFVCPKFLPEGIIVY